MGALIAAAWMCAADEPPPLDQIKGELKGVKPGAASELNAPAVARTVPMPSFPPAAGEPVPAPPPRSAPEAAGKKRAPDPNWLLHAMEERPEGAARPRRAQDADRRTPDRHPLDPADPGFMLGVYRAQEMREREQREASTPEAVTPVAKPGDFGSFSDLLQHWISPRDLSIFGLEQGAPAAADGGLGAPVPLPAAIPPGALPEPSKPNPFLDAVQPAPSPPEPLPAAVPPPAARPVAPPEGSLPGPLPSATPPGSQREAAPPAAPRQSDEKKYFPQVDRF